MSHLKMYILVLDDVPDRFAPVTAAHASLACYVEWQADEAVQEWFIKSFRKVVCRVSKEDFEKAKTLPGHTIMTESALEGREVSIALAPREEWPKFIQYLPLWKPKT